MQSDLGGTPKKKGKKANSAQSSILSLEEDAPAASMSFPPRAKELVTVRRSHAKNRGRNREGVDEGSSREAT
ncbi:hypothetical protein EJB05_55990, partial [Eragrostis curvula]